MATLLHDRSATSLGVTFEFVHNTISEKLIQQYYLLRQEIYTDYWHLENFEGGEDEYDKNSYTLLALCKNRCVGGIRLVAAYETDNKCLPMETKGFYIEELFKDLNLKKNEYGEIGRTALLPEFRNGKCSQEMYKVICLKSKELGHKYAFAVAPIQQARKVRIACRAFGLRADVCDGIPVPSLPTYENITMKLMKIHIGDWNISEVYKK